MVADEIDLTSIPAEYRRIVRSWYWWQVIYLRTVGQVPGESSREPEKWETPADVYWGGLVPRMVSASELVLINDREISYRLVGEGQDRYGIDKTERSSRDRESEFYEYDDAEKYLLLLISQLARPGRYDESPRYLWYQKGLDPRTSIRPVDTADQYPQEFYYSRAGEDRGWMRENDAIAFSHASGFAYEELDSILRQGIPEDWLDFRLVDKG